MSAWSTSSTPLRITSMSPPARIASNRSVTSDLVRVTGFLRSSNLAVQAEDLPVAHLSGGPRLLHPLLGRQPRRRTAAKTATDPDPGRSQEAGRLWGTAPTDRGGRKWTLLTSLRIRRLGVRVPPSALTESAGQSPQGDDRRRRARGRHH